jgi:hypothetical protein
VNIVSVSWADHLAFGEGDGQLRSPGQLERRIAAWRDELAAAALHWRLLRTRVPGRFSAARGYRHPTLTAARTLDWNDFEAVPRLAHAAGLQAWLYVTVFDEGWPLAPPDVRARSHHNAMHGQHVAWQSDLTRRHREWLVVDRGARRRQYGVVSLAYADARRAFVERWQQLLHGSSFDGLFLCLRSQSRPADHADQFGFNPPACAEFLARHGADPARDDFDVHAWRNLLGEHLTRLIEELSDALRREGRLLGVGVARGDVLGPPLGNTALHWRDWVARRLVDDLVIDQNSSQCPSMWHQLWPMHRGGGYLQNYLDGTGLPPFVEHVRDCYGPAFEGRASRLFVARQWQPRDDVVERELLATPGVGGLVFSSFRHDNPGAIARGDWRAGHVASACAAGCK